MSQLSETLTAAHQSGLNQRGLSTTLQVLTHPVVQHYLARLRHKDTPPMAFREALHKVATALMVKASEQLPTQTIAVTTPLTETRCPVLDNKHPIMLVPILRAGLSFMDAALAWLPMAKVYHLGLYRDEDSLQPVEYYNKLPEDLSEPQPFVFLLDPMLATGGSAKACIELLLARGIKEEQICFVCLLASPEGIKAVSEAFPRLPIVTAAVDECLNEKGYIVPGLGDAGDRAFFTF